MAYYVHGLGNTASPPHIQVTTMQLPTYRLIQLVTYVQYAATGHIVRTHRITPDHMYAPGALDAYMADLADVFGD